MPSCMFFMSVSQYVCMSKCLYVMQYVGMSLNMPVCHVICLYVIQYVRMSCNLFVRAAYVYMPVSLCA